MKQQIKQIQCENCKDFFPAHKKAYFKSMIVCQRCYTRLKENDRMGRKGTINIMTGL